MNIYVFSKYYSERQIWGAVTDEIQAITHTRFIGSVLNYHVIQNAEYLWQIVTYVVVSGEKKVCLHKPLKQNWHVNL